VEPASRQPQFLLLIASFTALRIREQGVIIESNHSGVSFVINAGPGRLRRQRTRYTETHSCTWIDSGTVAGSDTIARSGQTTDSLARAVTGADANSCTCTCTDARPERDAVGRNDVRTAQLPAGSHEPHQCGARQQPHVR
jgi:hypothetical protein